MKPFILFFLLIFGNSSCFQRQESVTEMKLGYFSAMCQGYCDYTFIITEKFKEIIRKPGTAIPSPELSVKKDTIKLTTEDWQQIIRSFTLDSVRTLPKINGCPGCDDDAIGSLQIISEKDTISLKFEGPNPPRIIKELINLITKETFSD